MSSIMLVSEQDADLVAWLALVVAFITLAWTIYWERVSARRRQIDEYWYRQIVGPNCVEPIIAFLNKWIDELLVHGANPPAATLDAMYTTFCTEKESLLSKLWLSKLFSNSFYDEAEETFDQVEDVFAEELTRSHAHANKPTLSPGNVQVVREKLIESATNLLVSAAAKQSDTLNGRLAGHAT